MCGFGLGGEKAGCVYATSHPSCFTPFFQPRRSLGCLDAQCALCEHNPRRRCSVNFAPKVRVWGRERRRDGGCLSAQKRKPFPHPPPHPPHSHHQYLVNDVLRAKCDAPIRVEVIDRATGLPAPPDALAGCHLEVCVLDGNAYDARCLEAGTERGTDLDAAALLLNNKGAPLLGAGGGHAADGRVILHLTGGAAPLPDLHVTDSSEALLSGRKPPFRLLVRAVAGVGGAKGAPPPARHAVSEGFVVATRRTRTAGKVEIPNVDDHVSKLEHMGKETVKKLQDIGGSAAAVGVDARVPDNCVESVGQFRRLALLAEGDGHLRQKLQQVREMKMRRESEKREENTKVTNPPTPPLPQVLKLSKEKWDDARDHALRAVVADSRARVWYADPPRAGALPRDASGGAPPGATQGLLFAARLGDVYLDRPLGLVAPGPSGGLEATLMAQLSPAQRDAVRALRPRAAAAWWQPGHPGWAIHPADSDAFVAAGGGGAGRGRWGGEDVGAARGGGRGRGRGRRGRRGRPCHAAARAPDAAPPRRRTHRLCAARGGGGDGGGWRGVPAVAVCHGWRSPSQRAGVGRRCRRRRRCRRLPGRPPPLPRPRPRRLPRPRRVPGRPHPLGPRSPLLRHPARRHCAHALGRHGLPRPPLRHVGRHRAPARAAGGGVGGVGGGRGWGGRRQRVAVCACGRRRRGRRRGRPHPPARPLPRAAEHAVH